MIRTTQDSDIIADLRMDHIPALLSALQNEFYLDADMMSDAIARRSSFNIIHRETFFKVDIFIPASRPFLTMQFSRSRREILSADRHLSATVASPEDTLLAKLEWYRLGGEVSERQWRDALGIIKMQSEALDRNYLTQTAIDLRIDDLLAKALQEADSY